MELINGGEKKEMCKSNFTDYLLVPLCTHRTDLLTKGCPTPLMMGHYIPFQVLAIGSSTFPSSPLMSQIKQLANKNSSCSDTRLTGEGELADCLPVGLAPTRAYTCRKD